MTKQQVNAQGTDTSLSRGQPQLSRWIRKKNGQGFSDMAYGVLLLYDNVRPHSATAMKNPFATLGWEYLHHPPYSPDLATSDFYLFPALNKNLTGRNLESNAEVKQCIKRFYRMQSSEFFLDIFLKLIKWYGKCLNALGTCVGK
ncbi:histone-lysine N-methyltransferase SETMAR [Trichonephila clavipes]|nr:histone-lysine N-methyltransferase SETMAR [Trichonephila clavipes]